MTRHHLRNEMDSISEKYCVDRADIGSARAGGQRRGLVKRYGTREAVAGIDVQVRRARSSPSRPERRGQDHDD